MKFLFCAAFLFLSMCCYSQSQEALIVKYGIKKVTVVTKEDGVDDKTTITYYDGKGNDTATYTYGSRYQYAVISYDKTGKILKKESFWDDGRPASVKSYIYARDGSYKVEDAYPGSSMKSTSWYNKKGHITKVQVPDGSIRTFTYDAKGNVIKKQTAAPGKKLKIETVKYKFDKKGRVIESLSSDGSKYTYKYNEKGLLAQSTVDFKGNEDLADYKAATSYQYE